ncbi:uncharacterized protein TNCV_3225601 [Trichonephila clavipes]|nr:uncharacterized protein TNCV_3225601 [Trichonephila clavipes]
MRTIGQGHAAMTTFCGVMDFPPPVAEKSYNNIINKLQLCSKEVAEASMQKCSFGRECLKNHNGSAGMMETAGMVRIFQRSVSHRSVRYTSYIGDGDSKTFSSITASNPYGEDITVSKIECVGHVQKNRTRLRKLKQMSSKLSDGKSIGGKEKVDRQNDDLITTYYGNAIRQNKTCLSDMRKAVCAVYFHIRSSDEEPLHSFVP